MYGVEEECVEGFVGRPLARPRRRWKDNIKIGLQEMGWEGMD
jgi:hypothetical protein